MSTRLVYLATVIGGQAIELRERRGGEKRGGYHARHEGGGGEREG